MPEDIISIVVVTDEHYIILLAALLKSVEVHHITGETIRLYIIEDGVKAASKIKLLASVSQAMFKISWVKARNAKPKEVKLPNDRTSFPFTIYMRLFVHNIIDAHTKKVLFLDVDMIVLSDISDLWNTDVENHIIAAVQDPRLLTFDNKWGGIFNYRELGFAPDTKYFNTGLLLINIPKWIEKSVSQRVITIVNDNIKYANYPDQYGLNIVLANNWLELDSRWNYFASGDLKAPFLIHFISRKPIYKSYANNPFYKQLFSNYLNLTLWSNAKPISELMRYLKKLKNIGVKLANE